MKNASIILIVKDDPGAAATIDNLLSHSSSVKFEVVVVVRKTKGDKLQIQNNRVKLVSYINENKSITIPEQRNLGIKSAAFDPIVFIDASCTPSERWLDNLFSAYEEGESIVAGFVGVEDGEKRNAFGDYHKSKYIEECPTANVLIAKKVFEDVGGFDESFDYGSDVDLMWRARDVGFKIRYVPEAEILHEKSDFKSEVNRSFRYGKARLQLYLKHPERANYFLKKDAIIFFYVLFILFLPVAVVFPYYFLLLLVPVVKNWKTSPFRQVLLNLMFGWGVICKGVTLLFKHS